MKRMLSLVLMALALGLSSCSGKKPDAGPPDELKYVPDGANAIFSVRVAEGLASDGFAKLKKQIPDIETKGFAEFKKDFGFDLTNVERMTGGGKMDEGGGPVMVMTLKQPVKAEDVKKAREEPRYKGDKGTTLKETKVGSFTMYEPEKDEYREAFCLVSDKVLVVARAKQLKPVLERNKAPEWSAGIQAGLKQADFSAAMCSVVDTASLQKDLKGKPSPLPGVDPEKAIQAMNAVVITGKLAGADLNLRVAAVCKDAAGAADVKKQADEALKLLAPMAKAMAQNLPPEMREAGDLPEKIKTAVSGDVAEMTLAVPQDTGVKLLAGLFLKGEGKSAPPELKIEPEERTRPAPPPKAPEKGPGGEK